MSEVTKIQWATSTGNPWIGCTKVSPGCKNCYAAELDNQRFSRTMGGGTKEKPVSHWGKGAPRFRTKGFWKDAVRWNREAGEPVLDDIQANCPVEIPGPRPRIFPSLCDWLDEEVPIEWLADFLKLIHETPNLDWLLLTKRPELFLNRLYAAKVFYEARNKADAFVRWLCAWAILGKIEVPQNVWIGTSVENQEYADKRIPELLKIPARIRFLSVEPLLGPVELDPWLRVPVNRRMAAPHPPLPSFNRIDWVIVGGESGKGARPCQPQWIREIVQQCRAASVPVFVKQLGANVYWDPATWQRAEYADRVAAFEIKHPKGGEPEEWPEDLRVREFPKEHGRKAKK